MSDRVATLFIFAIIAVILVFVANLFSIGHSSFGEWGDFFGGVLNPILTFITFSGLLLTIILQQKELAESRLQYTRSADSLKITQKQDHFFRSLEIQNSIIDSIDLHNVKTGVTTTGRDCFSAFYSRFTAKYQDAIKKHSSVDDFKILAWSFDRFLKENEQDLTHYFRHFEAILQFIDLLDADKEIYARQLRSTLSNRELLLLFYYCASQRSDLAKKLVEKYGILEGLPRTHVVRDLDLSFVKESAFGEASHDGKPRFSDEFRGTPKV